MVERDAKGHFIKRVHDPAFKNYREGSKRQIAAKILRANPKLSMTEVSKLIEKATGLNLVNARAYYTHAVTNGYGPGKVEAVDYAKQLRSRNGGESKRQLAVKIMTENAKLGMDEVTALIAKETGLLEANARQYYKNIVERGLAPGQLADHVRKPRSGKDGGLSKRAIIAKLMTENASKSMDELVPVIAKEVGFNEALTRHYYKSLVAAGVPGVVTAHVRKNRAVKAKVADPVKKERARKSTPKVLNTLAGQETTLSPDEIEAIKKTNLARMKKVTKAPEIVPEAAPSPEAEAAKARVAELEASVSESDVPAFLRS